MAVKQVYHQNMIDHEINHSLEKNSESSKGREVFCKKNHKVMEPLEKDCSNCPYFAGWMQGYGHECVWEDVIDASQDVKVIPQNQARQELYRVSKLIDQGIIKKG